MAESLVGLAGLYAQAGSPTHHQYALQTAGAELDSAARLITSVADSGYDPGELHARLLTLQDRIKRTTGVLSVCCQSPLGSAEPDSQLGFF